MTNLREDPHQLSLFDQPHADVGGTDADYTYRVASNGDFVVSGFVPGYGRVTARNRFLFPAVSEFRARYAAASAAVQALF